MYRWAMNSGSRILFFFALAILVIGAIQAVGSLLAMTINPATDQPSYSLPAGNWSQLLLRHFSPLPSRSLQPSLRSISIDGRHIAIGSERKFAVIGGGDDG